jgi:hypothetical protein
MDPRKGLGKTGWAMLGLAGALITGAPRVWGAPPSVVWLSLSKRSLTVRPGQTVYAPAHIYNAGPGPAHVSLYTAQAQPAPQGGYRLAVATPMAKWLSLSQYRFSLAPRTMQSLVVGIHVPRGTPPGNYVLAVVSQQSEPSRVQHSRRGISVQVHIILKNAYTISVNVPGKIRFGVRISSWKTTNFGRHIRLTTVLLDTGNSYEYASIQLFIENPSKRQLILPRTILLLAHSGTPMSFFVPARLVRKETKGMLVVRLEGEKETVTATGPLFAPPASPGAKHRRSHATHR